MAKSKEILLDPFLLERKDLVAVWIDSHPHPMSLGRTEDFDTREVLNRFEMVVVERLINPEDVGIAVGHDDGPAKISCVSNELRFEIRERRRLIEHLGIKHL